MKPWLELEEQVSIYAAAAVASIRQVGTLNNLTQTLRAGQRLISWLRTKKRRKESEELPCKEKSLKYIHTFRLPPPFHIDTPGQVKKCKCVVPCLTY